MLRPALFALLAAPLLSCTDGTPPAPTDGGTVLPDGGTAPIGQPTPAKLFGAEIKKVVVEVDYAQGAEPYTGSGTLGGDTWALFKANATKLFEGQSKTLEIPSQLSQMEALTDATGADFTAEQILALAKSHRGTPNTADTASFYALWLNGYFRDSTGQRKDVLGVSLGATGVLAIFKPVVQSTQGLFPNTVRYVEQSTLIHEFGHAVGLVNNGIALTTTHQDTAHGAHCTNTKCVMYWANEGPSDLGTFVATNVTTGTSILWGAECLDDVAALRK